MGGIYGGLGEERWGGVFDSGGRVERGVGFTQRGMGKEALHKGWSRQEEGDLQLSPAGRSFQPVPSWGAGVPTREAHSWCRGARGGGT